MKSHRFKPHTCPGCGHENDAGTPVTGKQIPVGAVSVCFYCGRLGILEADRSIRPATDDEVAEIMRSESGPMIQRLQRGLRRRAVSQPIGPTDR